MPAPGGGAATCARPQPHRTMCMRCSVVRAVTSGTSVTWQARSTPSSVASARSAPHSHAPSGRWSTTSASSAHGRLVPAAPRCLPRLRFAPPVPGLALRAGFLRPGRSSVDGGMLELPLLRDTSRLSRSTSARSRRSSAACSPTSAAWLSRSVACSRTSASSSTRDSSSGSSTRRAQQRSTRKASTPARRVGVSIRPPGPRARTPPRRPHAVPPLTALRMAITGQPWIPPAAAGLAHAGP
jgi:hypothetical protein